MSAAGAFSDMVSHGNAERLSFIDLTCFLHANRFSFRREALSWTLQLPSR